MKKNTLKSLIKKIKQIIDLEKLKRIDRENNKSGK